MLDQIFLIATYDDTIVLVILLCGDSRNIILAISLGCVVQSLCKGHGVMKDGVMWGPCSKICLYFRILLRWDHL